MGNVVLTIGSFDGMHLGHQAIVRSVVERADTLGGIGAVLTMHPHPREYFSPDHAPNLLTSHEKKLELFEAHGLDAAFVLPFDSETAQMEPEAFVGNILVGQCHAREIIVGHDFRFGRGAQGDYDFLQRVALEQGFTVSQMPPLLIAGERVSSTVIRERVLQGDLGEVERFLGRRYSLRGQVEVGRGTGKTLGFPTANIKPHHNAIPAHGVYAAVVAAPDGEHRAAVNIGIAPTIRNEDIIVEAFLLDYEGDLREATIEVVFHTRLRPEKKFPTREALVAQITADVAEVRGYFGD
jgi:riboflavin kinase/FMN adenylyltransferase